MARHSLLVLADQAIVSVANFLTAIIVGRTSVKDELGLYGLGFSVVILLAGIPKALVWTPYTTYCPRKNRLELSRYTGSVTAHLMVLGGIMALGMLTTSLLLWPAGGQRRLAELFLFLAPCIVLMLIREHVRRLCLAWMHLAEVLVLDLVVSCLQVLGLVLVAWVGWLSGTTAYLVVAAACSMSLAWFLWRRGQFSFELSDVRRDAVANWRFSRWIFLGAVAVLISNGAYRWILKWLHGVTAVGELTSAQSVIQIANPILLGIANYYGPVSAVTYARQGARALGRSVVRSSLMLVPILLTFFAVLLFWGGDLVGGIFGAQFGGQGLLVMTLACGLFSEAMLMPLELGLLTAHRGHVLCMTALLRLTVSMTLGVWLVWQLGASGVGIAMLVGNLAALAIQAGFLYQLVQYDR